jgi:hypothetical protein
MASQFEIRNGDGSNSWVLILGLDLGTTSFKIAMLAAQEHLQSENPLQLIRNADAHVAVLENFPGHQEHRLSSVPTCLIYDNKQQLFKWGHEAESYQSDENFDPDFFVRNWKMSIHSSADPAASRLRQNIQAQAKRLGKDDADIFAEDFTKALSTFLLEDHEYSPVLKHWGAKMKMFRHVDIVLAVPPGWPREEHEVLGNAVARGLGENRSFRIFRASETECVLRSWMQEEGDMIQAKVSHF